MYLLSFSWLFIDLLISDLVFEIQNLIKKNEIGNEIEYANKAYKLCKFRKLNSWIGIGP